MLAPLSAIALLGTLSEAHWLIAAFGAGAEHLFWKKFLSWPVRVCVWMFVQVSCIRPPASGFGVRMFRESVAGPTSRSIRSSACHWIVALTLPVTGSMVCAKILPDQVLVW